MSNKDTARYISRYGKLRLVLKPAHYETVDGRRNLVPGKDIRFVDGFYETDDKDEIAFLDAYCEKNAASQVVIKAKKDAIAERNEALKSLEEREADLARREEALAQKEAKADRKKPVEGSDDGLDALSVAELQAECEFLDVSKRGNKEALKERIREARKAQAAGAQY